MFYFILITLILQSSARITSQEYEEHCPFNETPTEAYKEKCCEHKTSNFADCRNAICAMKCGRKFFRVYSRPTTASISNGERWQSGGTFLTTYLHTLRAWNCSSYYEECNNPTYQFNRFTKLVYKLFCHPEQFRSECSENSHNANQMTLQHVPEHHLTDYKNSTDTDMFDPCLSVSMYKHVGQGRYFEVIEPFVPFCDIIWVGMDAKFATQNKISPWKLMPSRCHVSIIIGMTVMLILALLIVVANLTIILIFIKRKKMRNCQFYYKLSIAVADLFVGAIVIPCCIASQYRSLIAHRPLGNPYDNITFSKTWQNDSVALRHDGGGFRSLYTQSYINFVGFITSMSLFVSVYTLIFASFDRFYAVFKPIQYRNGDASKMVKISCAFLWVASVIISTIPLYPTLNLPYGMTIGGLVVSTGNYGMLMVLIAFVLPLVFLWIMTILTLAASLKYAGIRSRISSINTTTGAHGISIEFRLARTLSLMVGVFSVCVIPTIIIIMLPIFVTSVHYNIPHSLDLRDVKLFLSFQYAIVIVLFSNSLWNFFIYSARDKKFRIATKEEIKQLFKCLSKRQLMLTRPSQTDLTDLQAPKEDGKSFCMTVAGST